MLHHGVDSPAFPTVCHVLQVSAVSSIRGFCSALAESGNAAAAAPWLTKIFESLVALGVQGNQDIINVILEVFAAAVSVHPPTTVSVEAGIIPWILACFINFTDDFVRIGVIDVVDELMQIPEMVRAGIV